MLPNVEYELKRYPDSPKHSDIETHAARQSASSNQFLGMKQADKGKGENRKDDIAAIDPMHLPVQPRQSGKFCFPVQPGWHKSRGQKNSELSETCNANEEDQPVVHRHVAPTACMKGRIMFLMNGG